MAQQSIDRVQPLIDRARRLQSTIERLEADTKHAKHELRRVLDIEIPELMNELGLSEVKTKDGLMVEVVPFVDARIPKARQHEALDWLRHHGYGDLIKHQVVATLGAGDDEMARAIQHYLEEIGVDATDKATVHPQTLKAWARERLADGEEIPEDLFGLYTGQTTKIKEAK